MLKSRDLIVWMGLSGALLGCSSIVKYDSGKETHFIHRIILKNLKVRRPLAIGAHPYAPPGGVDYQSDPLPDEKFDCESIQSLFSLNYLKAFRECFKSVSEGNALLYRLKRDTKPYLLLDQEEIENIPKCIQSRFNELPVPREIFFQSAEKGILSCYSARLDIAADEILGSKLPMSREGVRIYLPIMAPLETDQDAIKLLMTWVLSPFLSDGNTELHSKVVPESLCKACLGEKEILRINDPIPLHWPELDFFTPHVQKP